MEISQLCKSTYNNRLQQSVSLRLPRYARTIYFLGQGQIKVGFEISGDPPVLNRQKVEKIKTLPVCLSWKL